MNGHGHEAERVFAAENVAGDIPTIRRIRAALHVGQPRAREVQAHLETLTPAGAASAGYATRYASTPRSRQYPVKPPARVLSPDSWHPGRGSLPKGDTHIMTSEPPAGAKTSERRGELVPFPGGYEIEPDVLEGEIVGEPPPSAPAGWSASSSVVVQHPHAKTTGRHLAYIPLGVAVVTKRLWDSRTTARYERLLRAAEAAGNHEAALEWEKRLADFRKDRHARRVDMVKVPVEVLLLVPKIALGVFIVFAAFGILLAIATEHIAEVAVPFKVAAHVAELVAIVLSVSWGPIVLALPWIAVGGALARRQGLRQHGQRLARRQEGRRRRRRPGSHCGHGNPGPAEPSDTRPAKAFKDGWQPTFYTQPVREGLGYATVYSLPLGVTPQMIADKRAVLARNVHRDEIEVWPTAAERAGHVATWVADPGVLSKPAPEYPLLHEGTADVFKGVPGGVSPRGDEITIPIVGNNLVFGGQMGQGKTNASGSLPSGAPWIRSPRSTCMCSPTTGTLTPTAAPSPVRQRASKTTP